MKRYTYAQISKLVGKDKENIRNLIYKLGIKTILIKGFTHIDQEGLEIVEAHYAPKTPRMKNNRSKIGVIERYLKTYNYRDVAKMCRISRTTVKLIIEEWEQTGCIVVDSSINFPEKTQNRGVFKRGKKWGYCMVKNKIKYYKAGFDDELSALEELLKLKERLR